MMRFEDGTQEYSILPSDGEVDRVAHMGIKIISREQPTMAKHYEALNAFDAAFVKVVIEKVGKEIQPKYRTHSVKIEKREYKNGTFALKLDEGKSAEDALREIRWAIGSTKVKRYRYEAVSRLTNEEMEKIAAKHFENAPRLEKGKEYELIIEDELYHYQYHFKAIAGHDAECDCMRAMKALMEQNPCQDPRNVRFITDQAEAIETLKRLDKKPQRSVKMDEGGVVYSTGETCRIALAIEGKYIAEHHYLTKCWAIKYGGALIGDRLYNVDVNAKNIKIKTEDK